MDIFTARNTEYEQLLGVMWPQSISGETNLPSSGYYDFSPYERVIVRIYAGDIGTSLDVDIEVSEDTSGTNLHTLKSMTQLTQAAGDDDSAVAIEIMGEELVYPSGATGDNYQYFRVEVTPSGATLVCVAVFGICPKYKPRSTSIYAEVVT